MSLLRAAADRAGCEAILALADIKETHDAYPADEVYDTAAGAGVTPTTTTKTTTTSTAARATTTAST